MPFAPHQAPHHLYGKIVFGELSPRYVLYYLIIVAALDFRDEVSFYSVLTVDRLSIRVFRNSTFSEIKLAEPTTHQP